jgi:carboxyl-terminal processing protease
MLLTSRPLNVIASGCCVGLLISLTSCAGSASNMSAFVPAEELAQFAQVYARIKSMYVDEVDDAQLITDAAAGMVSSLDPHSEYLNEEDMEQMRTLTEGQFGGIGITIEIQGTVVRIVEVTPESAASKAGIRVGDTILALDDEPLSQLKLHHALAIMRGAPGTEIKILISRDGVSAPMHMKLTRTIIKVPSVSYRLLQTGYAYLRIAQFQENTAGELGQALDSIYEATDGALAGLVLDLRDNPGGLLTAAVATVSAFLPRSQLVMSTIGRTKQANLRLTTSPEDYVTTGEPDYLALLPDRIKTVPLIVLVDGTSASAAEVVAGALQDYARATIVGSRTFGKGSVQTLIPIGAQAALKLTTARFYTPAGRSIQVRGVVPDIMITCAKRDLNRLTVREADLPHHLVADAAHTKARAPMIQKSRDADSSGNAQAVIETGGLCPGETSKEDYALTQAMAVLLRTNKN